MVSVNSAFHNYIKDESREQMFLLTEYKKGTGYVGAYYTSLDGDMSTDGATFMDEMCSGDDYTLGCTHSRSMNVTLMNLEGQLTGHNFGWLDAVIGVYASTTTQTLGTGVNASFVYNEGSSSYDATYYAKTDGFYKDSTNLFPGNCVGLFSVSGVVVFFIKTASTIVGYRYLATPTSYSFESANLTDYECHKYANGRAVYLNKTDGEFSISENGETVLYYICDLGFYKVDRPQNTMGQTITITDAFDPMHQLDTDATNILKDLRDGASPPSSCQTLLLKLLLKFNMGTVYGTNVPYSRLGSYAPRFDVLLSHSYTVRQIVGYICELIGCNARCQGFGFYVYKPDEEVGAESYPVLADRIAVNTVSVQEYKTPYIDSVTVTPIDGVWHAANIPRVRPAEGGDYTYEIVGNPFNVERYMLTVLALTQVQAIPTFYPMTFNVINADPSFQTGDLISVGFYTENEELTTYDEDEITTYSGDTITVNPPIGYGLPVGMQYIPIMSQTLTFDGRCSATYEAKGTADRSSENTSYAEANSRTSNTIYTGQLAEDVLASAVSLTASTTTGTNLCSVTLEAGTWMIYGYVQFSAVSGGARRVVCISSTSASLTDTIRNDNQVTSNVVTTLEASGVVTPSASTTYYLNACSSAACSANATNTLIKAIRLM